MTNKVVNYATGRDGIGAMLELEAIKNDNYDWKQDLWHATDRELAIKTRHIIHT